MKLLGGFPGRLDLPKRASDLHQSLKCYFMRKSRVQVLRKRAAGQAVGNIVATPEGKEGLLVGLEEAMKTDGALRAQMAILLNKQLHNNGSGQGLLIPSNGRKHRCVPSPRLSLLLLLLQPYVLMDIRFESQINHAILSHLFFLFDIKFKLKH